MQIGIELFFFSLADITELTFSKTIYEKRLFTLAKQNYSAIPLRLTFSRTGNPLFDNTTTKISIDLPIFRTLDSIP